jgi:NAD(P)-dependent dehydrogenase (short-subunit alcohol dehydrogenase family)
VHCDVSAKADMKALLATATDQIGELDTPFSSAGIGSTTSILDAGADECDQAFAVTSAACSPEPSTPTLRGWLKVTA